MTTTNTTWERENVNDFILLSPEGEEVCTISRVYANKMSANGFGLVVDRDKPSSWVLIRSGRYTIQFGEPDMGVRAAKALALDIVNGRS